MADESIGTMEAKRAARRRNILQNSESRMNRLLGKIDKDESGIIFEKMDKKQEENNDMDSSLQNSSLSHSKVMEESASSLSFEIIRREANSAERTHTKRLHKTGKTTLETNETGESHLVKDLEKSNMHSTSNTQKSAATHADMLRSLELIRVGSCIMVSFITSWCLSFGLGIIFLELVLLPFVLLEGYLYYFQRTHMKTVQLPHRSNMMSGALILCGIKPDLVSTYGKIMGYTTALSEDFSFFLFSFLIFSAVMT